MKANEVTDLFGIILFIISSPLVLIGGFYFLWNFSELFNFYPLGVNVAIFVYGLTFGVIIFFYCMGKCIEKVTEVN